MLAAAAAMLAGVALMSGAGMSAPLLAAVLERVAVDPHTGLAIAGFDPVAYFTEGQALQGDGDFEQAFAGAVWRFRNEGNQAAFAADPAVYAPRFGGFDPAGVARGVPVPGNPQYWLIRDQSLYLFYSDDSKSEFLRDPDRLIATADSAWPKVQYQIAP
jgi:hypothetical protein